MLTDQQLKLASTLEGVFNELFASSYETILVNEGDEPIYLPKNEENSKNRIVFAHGFWSSALHEIAHWCVAGEKRRTKVDYGYWYMPDGRDELTQKEFEKVEVKPQALEWIFTASLGEEFFLSTDNLSGDGAANLDLFKIKVRDQVKSYLDQGIPKRAKMFSKAIQAKMDNEKEWERFSKNIYENKILPL